jgi:hypothetical protein
MASTRLPLWQTRAQAILELKRRRNGNRYAQYQDRPVDYARDVLGVQWWAKQIEIAESVRLNRRTVVYAGHSVGKTHLAGGLVQWHYDAFDPSITLTTAPSWSSIHDLLWGEISAQRPQATPGRLLEMRIDGGPMHYAKGHNAESGAGFQGRHEARVLIMLDEAQGIPPFIWEGTEAMMTAPDCRVIAFGNPTETSGQYYEIRDDPGWNAIHISCLDHPNVVAGLVNEPVPFPKAVGLLWVQEMIAKHATATATPDADAFEFPTGSGEWFQPNDVFRSRVLGLHPRQASEAVWSEAWLQVARVGGLAWAETDMPEIGVDVARYGQDKTTLYARRGPVVLKREQYAKQDTMATAGCTIRLASQLASEAQIEVRHIPIKVDDTGLGGGVTDRLKELGYNVAGINFGDSAIDREEFFNRGGEMWFTVAYRARDKRLDLSRLEEADYRTLSAELRARRYKIQSDKTLRVESKDEIKKRIGRSPDDADALVLAFAMPPAGPSTVKITGW